MPSTKFTANGMLIFPDVGKDGKVTGPYPGLTVTAKRTMKDVEFSLTVPAAKAAKEQSLNGTLLGLKNSWSEQFSNVIYAYLLKKYLLTFIVDSLLPHHFTDHSVYHLPEKPATCFFHATLHASNSFDPQTDTASALAVTLASVSYRGL